MRLVAIFESWHVPDGNYPPFDQGQAVRLSFEVDDFKLAGASSKESWFKVHDDASCEFSGVILGRYDGLTALDVGNFRFYVHGTGSDRFNQGRYVRGTGLLAVDHYAWFEGVSSFVDPPDLFFRGTIVRIRQVRIPERFIRRDARGKTMPTSVGPGEYTIDDVEELVTMKGQAFDEEFYLLDVEVVPRGKVGG